MSTMSVAKIAWWAVGVLASLAVPLAALAAEPKAKAAPLECPSLEAGLPWGPIFIALIALGGVCVVAFKNANRTA
jgi:hypothetical protein